VKALFQSDVRIRHYHSARTGREDLGVREGQEHLCG